MTKKIICSLLTAAAVTLTALTGCTIGKKKYSGMDVTFLKVGKADAVIITTENHTVLIDTAEQGDGKEIYQFCSSQERNDIDYLIITHFDQDHVGGAKAVLNKFNSISNILQPGYTETSDEYKKYTAEAEKKGYVPTVPDEPVTFTLDDALFTVYPAMDEAYSQVNNYSLVVTAEYGKKAFVFAGDAEKARISEIMKQLPERKDGYDFIKIPHHGKAEKNTDKLIEFLKPSLAVITCSEKNPPDDETLNILSENNVETFFTYNGDITFNCDGYQITHSEQKDE